MYFFSTAFFTFLLILSDRIIFTYVIILEKSNIYFFRYSTKYKKESKFIFLTIGKKLILQ